MSTYTTWYKNRGSYPRKTHFSGRDIISLVGLPEKHIISGWTTLKHNISGDLPFISPREAYYLAYPRNWTSNALFHLTFLPNILNAPRMIIMPTSIPPREYAISSVDIDTGAFRGPGSERVSVVLLAVEGLAGCEDDS